MKREPSDDYTRHDDAATAPEVGRFSGAKRLPRFSGWARASMAPRARSRASFFTDTRARTRGRRALREALFELKRRGFPRRRTPCLALAHSVSEMKISRASKGLVHTRC